MCFRKLILSITYQTFTREFKKMDQGMFITTQVVYVHMVIVLRTLPSISHNLIYNLYDLDHQVSKIIFVTTYVSILNI